MKSNLPVTAFLFVFPIIFLAIISLALQYNYFYSSTDFNNQIIRSNQALVSIRQILIDVQNAETGQRGYVITGKEDYLAPYNEAVTSIEFDLQKVKELLPTYGKDPQIAIRFADLSRVIGQKLTELANTIELRRTTGFAAAAAVVDNDVGMQYMVVIRRLIDQFQSDQRRQLDQLLSRSAGEQSSLRFAIFGGSAISVLAMIFVAVLTYQANRQRRLSQQALQDKAMLLNQTLTHCREGVALFDGTKKLRAYNENFRRELSLPAAQDMTGWTLSQLIEAESGSTSLLTGMKEVVERTLQQNKPILVEVAEGERRLELTCSPAEDNGFSITNLDITLRRKTEEALRQSQKMESLGYLTGGIAHDFNNLLTVIIGNLDLLLSKQPNADLRDRAEAAMTGAERGALLVRRLLAFARRQPLEPKPVNLARLVGETADLLRRTIGEPIELETVIAGGVWTALLDSSQFEAALINLALNARDAMPNGGKLTIEISNAELDDIYVANEADLQPGQYVMVAVTDTGNGMKPEIIARAFEPFFTTKVEHSGTGLGLSMVYGFIKQSHGHIKIYSEVGQGTTIKMYLPRVRSTGESLPPPVLRLSPKSGKELVMMVEDDEPVRNAAALMLQELGYSVIEAANGAEALELLESGIRPDLLFSDVIMPGPVSAATLAREAQQRFPHLKVLFTSGYTQNSIIHNGKLDEGLMLLSKPYRQQDLATKLRALLDQPDKSES